MVQQKLSVAEPPEHTDTRHATVAGRIDIHITVTDIHRRATLCTELAQCLVHRVGRRLLMNVRTLTDSYLDVQEEMVYKILRRLG